MEGYRNQDGIIPASTYPANIDLLLTEDAEEWLLSTLETNVFMDGPTEFEADFEIFPNFFEARFPRRLLRYLNLNLTANIIS